MNTVLLKKMVEYKLDAARIILKKYQPTYFECTKNKNS